MASCSNPPEANNGAGQPQEYPVYAVQNSQATLLASYPASLEGEQNVEIRPKVDGYISQIYVDEGATVKKGQLLFKIDAPQYQQEVITANASIKSAEAEVNAAKLQVANITPLVKKEIVTGTALQNAQYNLQAKEAQLAQARATLANAKTNIGYTTIVSPAAGVVGKLPNKPGSLVSPSSPVPLTTVSNIQKIYAYFSFDEKQFLEFSAKYPGKSISEKIKQLPAVSLVLSDGMVYPEKGRIETVNGLIDNQTGSVSFRATFPNPLGTLRSGGSATLQIPVSIASALLLPQKATFEVQGRKMVYVVNEKGMVKGKEVQVMDLFAGNDYVVKDGLKAGDRVVTDGMGNLKDSVTIKPVPVTNGSAH
ncbi:MAG: efflux RND transporter periplasmic adaptor subunit [Mucilaginibacter sp.]|uniref:efflux RND transporter periplasmic adaptor subunit n=1 Tax=Mucilaginibacter sp. TaxID=1882438 RepID=UPI0031A24B35